jgi:SNF2 family DNA or RNA helicase
VAAFQAGGADLFLISLRAGGTGLNLTAADYVVHLDPWWNPAVEDQASDRAHRIGQERPVTIYRLIMQDSIEERILQLHRDKRDLASDILEGGEVSARLSEEALLDLIRA